jgi:TRAP-type mannitol/chloroaromatic compound transport system permease small subunit
VSRHTVRCISFQFVGCGRFAALAGGHVKFLLAITRGIDACTTLLGRVAWWASLLLVLVGVQNVVGRYGYQFFRRTFGDNVAAALSNNTYFELQTLLYNIIFLLGAAYVLRVDSHVRVDIIFSRLRPRAKAWVDIVGISIFLLPFSWMGIFFGNTYVMRSWSLLEVSPNPGGLIRYPIKTLIIVAFALLILQGISQLIKNVALLRGIKNSGSPHEETDAPGAHGATAAVVTTPGVGG